MATHTVNDLPTRGAREAPHFNGSEPSEISRYFDDCEALAGKYNLTSDEDKTRTTLRYISANVLRVWENMPEYARLPQAVTGTPPPPGTTTPTAYADWRKAVVDLYPQSSALMVGVPDLEAWAVKTRTFGRFATIADLADMWREFLAIKGPLVRRKVIEESTADRQYEEAFPKELAARIRADLRVIPANVAREPGVPYPAEQFYQRAQYAVRDMSVPSSSSAGASAGSVAVKTEMTDILSMFAAMMKENREVEHERREQERREREREREQERREREMDKERMRNMERQMTTTLTALQHIGSIGGGAGAGGYGQGGGGSGYGAGGGGYGGGWPARDAPPHNSGRGPAGQYGGTFNNRPDHCFHCQKSEGHYARDCPMAAALEKEGRVTRDDRGQCLIAGTSIRVGGWMQGVTLEDKIAWYERQHGLAGGAGANSSNQPAARQYALDISPAATSGTTAAGFHADNARGDQATGVDVLSRRERVEELVRELRSLGASEDDLPGDVSANAFVQTRRGAGVDVPGASASAGRRREDADRPSADTAKEDASRVTVGSKSRDATDRDFPSSAHIEVVDEEVEHPLTLVPDANYEPELEVAKLRQAAEAAAKKMASGEVASEAKGLLRRVLDSKVECSLEELLHNSPPVARAVREAATRRRPVVQDVPVQDVVVDTMLQGFGQAAFDADEVLPFPGESPVVVASFAFDSNARPIADDDPAIVRSDVDIEAERMAKEGKVLEVRRLDGELRTGKRIAELRAILMSIGGRGLVECILDPGSAIVSMSEVTAEALGVLWNPDIQIRMQSANGKFDMTCGMAKNVPCRIGECTFYLQVHVVKSNAYSVLLGRPFDLLSESEIKNYSDGRQHLTLTDPNTLVRTAIFTHPRGKAPAKEDFRDSMI
ncbi:unnamed protein product [Peniophora sp. CBMAI 1063]|nr:unnamed protein product [Peniophora sp. CBMAI 1063]